MKVLITRPNYDDCTSYLFARSKRIIYFAKSKGIKILELSRPNLTRKKFESVVRSKKPSLILLNGHGGPNEILGDKVGEKEEKLVEEGKNHKLLEGKLSYALSCWAAASLGKTCTKDNKGCFIGYRLPFVFWMDERRTANPLKDKTADLFLRPSDDLTKGLLKGNSADEAIDKYRISSKKKMMEALKDKGNTMKNKYVAAIWHNLQALVALGDRKKRVS